MDRRSIHRYSPGTFRAPAPRRILWLAGILGIFYALHTTELSADVYTVQKKKQEIANTDNEIEAARNKARSLAGELQATRGPIKAEGIRLDNWLANLNQRINSFNSACAGRPKTAYCESTRATLAGEKIQLSTAQTAQQQQVTKQTGLYNALTLANARVQKLINYRDQLQANLEEELRMSCSGLSASASLEEIKNKCGNVQFDGTSIGLPPCQTERCREYESH